MRRYQGMPQSILLKLSQKEADITLWQWTSIQDQQVTDQETIDAFTALGYRQVTKEVGQAGLTCLLSQCYDVVYITQPEQEEKARSWDSWADQWWARAEDIEHVDPVILAFALPEMKDSREIITTLQFLPPPQLGEYAIILSAEADTTYNVRQLPAKSQTIWRELGDTLQALAAPGDWIRVTTLHAQCSNLSDYQHMVETETAMILQSSGEERAKHETMLEQIHIARRHIEAIEQAELKADWLPQWKAIQRMAQELATAYWEHHQSLQSPQNRAHSLPPLTSMQKTMLPSSNGFRGLVQSFGPGLQPDLWNSETSVELRLSTPNRTLLKVRGDGEHEHKTLHHYIMEEMGVEGLKHLVVLLDTYYTQTGAKERKVDASVSLRQLLIRMGYGNRADVKDEQRKLMHTLLYLSRTWIESPETTYIQAQRRRRGGRRVQTTEYTPLIVLERLKIDEIEGIKIPDVVEFHLGAEFYDLLFGGRQQYFTLPTALILTYHGTREQQEICLAFYLSNFLILNGGRYSVNFPTMLTESGVRLAEEIEGGHDRLRDALRVIYALERLEKDGWVTRAAHPDIDTALAVEFFTGECQQEVLSPGTYQRITTNYNHLRGASPTDLRRKRREALQRLLDIARNQTLRFSAGSLLKAQAEKRETQRQQVIAKSEVAQIARLKKVTKGKG